MNFLPILGQKDHCGICRDIELVYEVTVCVTVYVAENVVFRHGSELCSWEDLTGQPFASPSPLRSEVEEHHPIRCFRRLQSLVQIRVPFLKVMSCIFDFLCT